MLSASGFSKRTGKICLSVPACSLEDDVMLILNVLAGRKHSEIFLAQFPILIVLDPFDCGIRDLQFRLTMDFWIGCELVQPSVTMVQILVHPQK